MHFETTRSARKKYGFKLKVVLKWGSAHIENVRAVSLVSCCKVEGILKGILKLRCGTKGTTGGTFQATVCHFDKLLLTTLTSGPNLCMIAAENAAPANNRR